MPIVLLVQPGVQHLSRLTVAYEETLITRESDAHEQGESSHRHRVGLQNSHRAVVAHDERAKHTRYFSLLTLRTTPRAHPRTPDSTGRIQAFCPANQPREAAAFS